MRTDAPYCVDAAGLDDDRPISVICYIDSLTCAAEKRRMQSERRIKVFGDCYRADRGFALKASGQVHE